METKMLISTY